MGVRFLFKSKGVIRDYFYGEYYSKSGKRECVNLGVKVAGKYPESLRASDKGDEAYERSRERALVALENLQEEAQKECRDEATAFRIFRESTGKRLKIALIADMKDIDLDTRRSRSIIFSKWKKKVVADFVSYAERKKLKTVLA